MKTMILENFMELSEEITILFEHMISNLVHNMCNNINAVTNSNGMSINNGMFKLTEDQESMKNY